MNVDEVQRRRVASILIRFWRHDRPVLSRDDGKSMKLISPAVTVGNRHERLRDMGASCTVYSVEQSNFASKRAATAATD